MRQVDSGYVPAAIAVIARHGEVHIEAVGNLALEGAGSNTQMAAYTICRVGSTTKPIVAGCAMVPPASSSSNTRSPLSYGYEK